MPSIRKIAANTTLSGLADWEITPFLEKVTAVAPSVIYVYNQKTQSNEYSNHSIGNILGYSEAEIQTMGAALMPTLAHPDDLPRIGVHFGMINALKDGETATLEYRMKHKDGHWVWFLSHDTVFERDEDGTVLRHIGSGADITAQKEAEQKVMEEKAAADRANEELRAFSYALSHDLKSPSNTISLLLSEMENSQSDALGAEARELIEMAKSTARRMQRLIDDVLHYSEVMDAPPEEQEIDLNSVLEEVLQNLYAPIKHAGTDVISRDLPKVRGSEMQIRLLLQNLIENAVKFSANQSSPKVEIFAEPDPETGRVNLSVKDNGIGIASEYLSKIFDIFEYLNPRDTYPGTGLGLALCRRITDGHGGEIKVTSEPGHGACFTVDLPAV